MYIVAIAWLYVTLMMAVTERSVTAGILTFTFYGLLPCALLVWLIGTPARRRNRHRQQMLEAKLPPADVSVPSNDPLSNDPVNAPDRADTQRD
jgi:hypothetical protein